MKGKTTKQKALSNPGFSFLSSGCTASGFVLGCIAGSFLNKKYEKMDKDIS